LIRQILPFDEQVTPQNESLRGSRIENVRAKVNHGSCGRTGLEIKLRLAPFRLFDSVTVLLPFRQKLSPLIRRHLLRGRTVAGQLDAVFKVLRRGYVPKVNSVTEGLKVLTVLFFLIVLVG
jgi:hypothetical protein